MTYSKMKDTMLHAVDEIDRVYAELQLPPSEAKETRTTNDMMPGVAYMDSAIGLLPIDADGIKILADELSMLKERQNTASDISAESKERLNTILTECRDLQNELMPDLGSALDDLMNQMPEGRLTMQAAR